MSNLLDKLMSTEEIGRKISLQKTLKLEADIDSLVERLNLRIYYTEIFDTGLVQFVKANEEAFTSKGFEVGPTVGNGLVIKNPKVKES